MQSNAYTGRNLACVVIYSLHITGYLKELETVVYLHKNLASLFNNVWFMFQVILCRLTNVDLHALPKQKELFRCHRAVESLTLSGMACGCHGVALEPWHESMARLIITKYATYPALPTTPLLSMRDAVFTVSPNKQ